MPPCTPRPDTSPIRHTPVTRASWSFTAPCAQVDSLSSADLVSCHGQAVAKRRSIPRPWVIGGVVGFGAVGAAALSTAPAQAAPVTFPDWATVTGTVPDDAGFNRVAADTNNWTFSWSTDANGVVSFAYADGTTSSSAEVTPAPEVSAVPTLAVQSTPTAFWAPPAAETDPAPAAAEVGMGDLAAVAANPFGTQVEEPASPGEPAVQAGAVSGSDQAIVDTAYQGLGGAYVWGGTDFMAWDCSGYVQWVYAHNGLAIPRVTWDQFAAGTPTTQPRVGDLVSQNSGSHVGIYLGGDQMISALNPQEGTVVHSIHAMPLDGFYTYR